MKKLIAILVSIIILTASACAESAAEYARWLEEAFPNAAYRDAQVPEFVAEYLSADYDIVAREDAHYGTYIACSRKDSAPKLPDDVRCEAYGSFETGKFSILNDAGNVYYEFILKNGVSMQVYDNAQHIIITVDEYAGEYAPFASSGNMVYHAADPMRRSRLAYAEKKGLSAEGGNISIFIHNKESWQMGATKEPIPFYITIDKPQSLFGERWLGREIYGGYQRIPMGIYYQNGGTYWEFVISEGGVYGLESAEQGKLYAVGPAYQAVLDEIAAKLGYIPGEMDFCGKNAVRATFEWKAGEMKTENNGGYTLTSWGAGAVSIEDKAKLRKLDDLIQTADFTVGSVNCPSPAFMTIEYSDGSCASFAVAVNSFNLFFRNGVMFSTKEDIIDLFGIRETEFYKGYMG